MPDEDLAMMGVDRKRIGSAEDIQRRFSSAIRTGDPSQPAISFGIFLDEKLVGYTLLNRYSEEVNYSHWHIIVSNLRAKGILSALYPYRIKTYFDLAPISQLIHQTRTRNGGVNRMLDKFVPVFETKYIDKPDGVAGPGISTFGMCGGRIFPRFLPVRWTRAKSPAQSDPGDICNLPELNLEEFRQFSA